MKLTKEIYHEIFEELRTLLREMSVGDDGEGLKAKDNGENNVPK